MKRKPLQVEKAKREIAEGYKRHCEKRGLPQPVGRWKKRSIKP